MCGALLIWVREGREVVAQKVRKQVREQPVSLALLCLLERPGGARALEQGREGGQLRDVR